MTLSEIYINPNTLYYLFSATPQVLGTLIAILAAFVHFRISRLEDYLIGDGQSILQRQNQEAYVVDNRDLLRVKDAIARKNIYEIKAVYEKLYEKALKTETKEKNPTGILVIYEDRFMVTLYQIDKIKTLTLVTAVIAVFSVGYSLILLACVDLVKDNNKLSVIFMYLNNYFALITLSLALIVINEGLLKKVTHEAGWKLK